MYNLPGDKYLAGTLAPDLSKLFMSRTEKEIYANYTDSSIRVYQAYNAAIATSAVAHQTFVSPPFKRDRATWIKPSFCWMMERCGWASKENQEHVLAIDITCEGFRWALENAALSHYDGKIHTSYEQWKSQLNNSPVVIQWDPERDLQGNKLPYRSIQIGLKPVAVERYVNEWIQQITDITPVVKEIKQLIDQKDWEKAAALLPVESPVEFRPS